jgi:phospholipid/cholesterol/gamma-HCH transport system ATP-binding protein
MVIIGGSGTGKSVMLKCILGLIHPDSGSILVDGAETCGLKGSERDALMKKFGCCFRVVRYLILFRVGKCCVGLIHGKHMAKKEAKEIAIEKLKAVGLGAAVASLLPAELSGGMQKRVGLARAIATSPEIIFFDEPTTGLDPIMADVINNLIVECVKDIGATALSITHDMASARKIADYIAMIHQGRIVWSGPVADLDHSGNPYVDQFIHGRAEGPITEESSLLDKAA